MRGEIRLVHIEGLVLNQRAAGIVEVALPLGDGGVGEESAARNREALDRLLQAVLGRFDIPVRERGAPGEQQRFARRARQRGDAFERLARLLQRHTIVSRERALEPHLSEHAIQPRVVVVALERGTQREDRGVPPVRTRMGEPDGDLPRDEAAVEPGEHLQLLELIGAPIEIRIEIRQLFANGD
jgi:hypothetical protein